MFEYEIKKGIHEQNNNKAKQNSILGERFVRVQLCTSELGFYAQIRASNNDISVLTF